MWFAVFEGHAAPRDNHGRAREAARIVDLAVLSGKGPGQRERFVLAITV